MFRRLPLFAVLLLAACRPTTYQLGGDFTDKNAVLHTETQFKMTAAQVSMVNAETEIQGKMDLENYQVYNTKVLESDQGRASVVETFFEQDMLVAKPTFQGKTATTQIPNAMHQATMISRLTNGRWTHVLKDTKPTSKQSTYLKRALPEAATTPYPDRPLKVGESWNVPTAQLQHFLGSFADANSGEMKYTVIRETEVGGQKCLLLIADLKASGVNYELDGNNAKMSIELQGTVYRSLKEPVDVRCELFGTIKVEQTVQIGDQPYTISTSGPLSLVQTNFVERNIVPPAAPKATPATPAPSKLAAPATSATNATSSTAPSPATPPAGQPAGFDASRRRNDG